MSVRDLLFVTGMFLSILPDFHAQGADPKLWSLQPVQTDFSQKGIDQFIAEKRDAAGLMPVAKAEPTAMARRLYFNLVGLPPTPEQLAKFEKDGFEKTVDELLASPQFGEKWARHWLDLARYAETNGRDRNVVFAHAWRYRDWVIDSLNADLPYDEFIRQQVAGDLSPDAGDAEIVATGFLTLGPKSFQERDREKFLMDMVDEQIDVLSRSVLGLTVACSRCHDHKFDPIPQADYYALAGILLSSETLHGPGPLYFQSHQHDKPVVAIGPEKAKLDAEVKKWRGVIYEKTIEAMRLRSAGYKIRRTVTGALRERGLKKPEDDPELLKQHLESEGMYKKAETLMAEREELLAAPPNKPGYAMALREAEKPEDCNLREGGMPKEHGPAIPRGRLTIPGLPMLDEIGEDESGRRQLADWLVSEKNPLTARVIVNRVWHHLFGAGLVRSVDNFGVTGDKATHPELLDFLATKFVTEDGWSLKKLVKRVVTSDTWQLASSGAYSEKASAIDPGNSLYWRANLRRLDVEAFRDSVLQISGELDPNRPENGSVFSNAFLGNEYGKPGTNRVNHDEEIAGFQHRTVYLPIVRNEIPELLKQFDFADPNAPTGARNARTIPSQALYLMNDEFVETQSTAAANRLLKSGPESDSEKLDLAASWAFAGKFEEEVKRKTSAYLDERRSELVSVGKTPEEAAVEAWADVFQILFSGIRFRYLE
ncbi:MAG: DUF1549 domain-containing protein [Verrucomicrobiales bacterium]|nr:DUF1549 domain-containing protein [Verrucomicrobiales bacterium]